ncbi:MAG: hypothetical protein RBT59_10220 [Arcobacteraceae bacterium]|jgi:hypothetical protein|nr:hypothetical protein [Arcobacteraceae bacterium]
MLSVLTTIITAISAIIVAYIANNNREERKRILLKELTTLLENESPKNKYEVSKIFEFITRLKLSHSDIKELVSLDNSILIINALEKTPGLVTYKNKKLEYHRNFKPRGIRKAIHYFEKFSLYISFTTMTMSLFAFAFTNNIAMKSFSGILFFIFTFMWMSVLRSVRHTQEIENIIKDQDNKTLEE